eukprot:m.167430 g.167430  ORF g.167430 m.167430 type:complete len:61 (-) comp31461_c1_seq1:45-227(-)
MIESKLCRSNYNVEGTSIELEKEGSVLVHWNMHMYVLTARHHVFYYNERQIIQVTAMIVD